MTFGGARALSSSNLVFVPHPQERSLRCATRSAPHMCQLCLMKTGCCVVFTYIQSRIFDHFRGVKEKSIYVWETCKIYVESDEREQQSVATEQPRWVDESRTEMKNYMEI